MKDHVISFYKMDLYEKNFEVTQRFFNFMESTGVECEIINDDYNGEKYTCFLPNLPKLYQNFLSEG